MEFSSWKSKVRTGQWLGPSLLVTELAYNQVNKDCRGRFLMTSFYYSWQLAVPWISVPCPRKISPDSFSASMFKVFDVCFLMVTAEFWLLEIEQKTNVDVQKVTVVEGPGSKAHCWDQRHKKDILAWNKEYWNNLSAGQWCCTWLQCSYRNTGKGSLLELQSRVKKKNVCWKNIPKIQKTQYGSHKYII